MCRTTKVIRNFLLTLIFALLGNVAAHATIVTPAGFNPDDGTELFTHGNQIISLELFDLAGNLTPGSGASFGFYFANDPNTLIPIFTPADHDPASAIIDFTLGAVVDLQTNVLLNLFNGSGDIGFFLSLSGTTLYTQAALNPFGLDLTATFSNILTPSTYMLGFEANGTTLALEVVTNIRPVNIPEPETLLLMLFGLLSLVVRQRTA